MNVLWHEDNFYTIKVSAECLLDTKYLRHHKLCGNSMLSQNLQELENILCILGDNNL